MDQGSAFFFFGNFDSGSLTSEPFHRPGVRPIKLEITGLSRFSRGPMQMNTLFTLLAFTL